MKIKFNIQDLTLRGQLSKMPGGYGDNLAWTKFNDKELKADFFKTLNYYKEQKQYLNKSEKSYLEQLENIKLIVYGG